MILASFPSTRGASPVDLQNLLEQIANRNPSEVAPLILEQQDAFLRDVSGNQGESVATLQPPKILFTLGLGYETNPTAAQTNAHAAWMGHPDLNISVAWVPSAVDLFTFSYDASGTIYDGKTASADAAYNIFDVNWNRTFSHDAFATLDAKDAATFLGGKASQNKGDFGTTFNRYFQSHAWKLAGSYEFIKGDQLTRPSKPASETTANQHNVGATIALAPRDIPLGEASFPMRTLAHLPITKAELGYYHAWNLAVGSDNIYHSDKLTLSVAGITFGVKRLSGLVSYSHEWRDYERPNTLSPTGASRNDSIDRIGGELDYLPLFFESMKPKLFVRYDATFQDSNLGPKTYHDHQFQVGFSREF